MKILLLLLLTGCTPYIYAKHTSDPSIENDGLDIVGAGIKYKKDRLSCHLEAGRNLNSSAIKNIIDVGCELEL